MDYKTKYDGGTGVYVIPFSEYCSLPAMNASKLKHALGTGEEYKHALTSQKDSPSMTIGRATHTLVLEPDSYAKTVVEYNGTRRGKAWDEFKEANSGKDILKPAESVKVAMMASAVKSHKAAMERIGPGEKELTLVWYDQQTGMKCKCRIDNYCKGKFASDLKTAMAIDLAGFQKACVNYGYHLQAAFYLYGIETVLGEVVPFSFIPVQNDGPYDVVRYDCEDDFIAEGKFAYRTALTNVSDWEKSGEYLGISQEPLPLSLPDWHTTGAHEEIEPTELRFEGEI